MLTVEIVCVGGLKEAYWRDACSEYNKRLTPWAKVHVTEIAEERCANPSPAQIETVLAAEGARILAALPEQAYVVALCIEGEQMTSQQLSGKISQVMLSGNSTIAFVIGGSFGLSLAVKNRASLRFSMSKLTFPHQLSRVMLLEQFYRAMSILMGGKYHK
jgi:23S rRNA (pseudouridine1915-N3)-methyltransferase